jgi:hypothetical protein
MLGSSLGGRAARCSLACSHANAATSARAAVSLTQVVVSTRCYYVDACLMCALLCFVVPVRALCFQMYHAAFTSPVNNGDAAPATGSEEDRERTTMDEDPVSRAAEKAPDVAGKVRGAAEEVKEAGREVKDRAREVAEDVKESVKKTRP